MKVRLLFIGIIVSMLSCITSAQSVNNALLFDGTDDYVSIPHNNIFNVSKVTIEMWVLWQNSTSTAVNFMIGKATEELEIHTGGGSGSHAIRFIPTTKVYLDTDVEVFLPGNWYHIAFVYDPSISLYKCYINGVEKNLTNHGLNPVTTAIVQSSLPLRIGMRDGNALSFQGKIDEVRIWNTARTAEEISANMNNELTGTESGLIAYYKMSDGSGTTLTDNSPNGNNGTLLNGTQWTTRDNELPVELTSFSAKANGKSVSLNWKTATEVRNYGFEIQRSVSSISSSEDKWQKIGFVQGHGNSNSPYEYSFTDNDPNAGVNNYRLKQIDNDGQYKYYDAVSISMDAPKGYKLLQNIPNPFNPETAIKYELPENTFVTIKVYDATGREVATIVNQEETAGSHAAYWNGREQNGQKVSSGIYMYRMTAGANVITKKMNLLK